MESNLHHGFIGLPHEHKGVVVVLIIVDLEFKLLDRPVIREQLVRRMDWLDFEHILLELRVHHRSFLFSRRCNEVINLLADSLELFCIPYFKHRLLAGRDVRDSRVDRNFVCSLIDEMIRVLLRLIESKVVDLRIDKSLLFFLHISPIADRRSSLFGWVLVL